ncbi:hypothetical protein GH714_013505 [Hevea brasiliensis]|uniref:Protein kinase domain-containing protein n=1 Tax=Hevea brasiliensis TaxID=3981 RepID=A0A6A6N3T7_HEVBR|nr:hypothetical protein GH714_013505 [Hevea brasiliensis]
MAESLHIDVKQDDDNGSEKADRFAQKVSSLERIFLIANFILELPSAAFDQLSSVHKPQYALLTISYAFLSQHSDNPIKVSVWPVFFAFGLLSSRLSGNTTQRPAPHLRRVYRVEEFSLAQLAAATNDFSIENTIVIAHPYALYMGKLPDGSEVAVSRRDTGHQRKKFQEEDSYFENELTFLSRLHHKHLIRLVGYCEEDNERILVYEYVKNGSLHDLLHKNNVDKKSKRAVFKDEDNGGATSLVDFAVPKILANELVKVLDNRIGPPKLVKAEAVELVAYTALHCVNLEGNNRPSITNIVANLEQASSLCDVRNEGLPIGAEELHGRSNEVANSNGTEKHHSEVLERQQ